MKSATDNTTENVRSTAGAAPGRFSLDVDFLQACLGEFPDPVIATDAAGKMVFLNSSAKDLMGRAQNGESAPHIERVLESRAIEGNICFLDECLEGKKIDAMPVMVRNLEGQWFACSVTATPVRDCAGSVVGCIAMMRNFKEDRPVHETCQKLIATLDSIINNFPTPFFAVDRDMVITTMNSPMEMLTGVSKEKAIGRLTCAQVLPTPACNSEECPVRQAMNSGGPVSGLRRMVVDGSGRRIPVVVNASILTDSNGQITGAFEFISDISSIVDAEQKIKLLTELTETGILMVDESYRIVFANGKMAEISCLPVEQLEGMSISGILDPDQLAVIKDLMGEADCERRLSFCGMSGPRRASKGGARCFETDVGVSCIGKNRLACIYFRDITDRIEVERELRKTNDFFNSIIQGSFDGIIVVDTTGRTLIFNEGAQRILGYKPEEVIGRREAFRMILDGFVARDNMRKMRSNRYGPGKLGNTRISLRAKSGELIPVDISASTIRHGGEEIASVGIFSDQREHVKISQQLEEARLQVLQSEKIASLGRLAAGVAHEINNPLAGILIYAEILMGELQQEPQLRQDLQEIIDQAMRCKQIVIRLLEFSRQPIGHMNNIEINTLLDRSIALLGNLYQNIDFHLCCQPDLPPVTGDAGQIQQVFTNLITNAAYAMNNKGRLVISSSFDQDTDQVVLSFVDTGPGIPAEIANKIFEPFFTTKCLGEGTGLGLSVAYGIIKQHGGEIEAGNMPEGGAIFTVRLPLECPESMVAVFEE